MYKQLKKIQKQKISFLNKHSGEISGDVLQCIVGIIVLLILLAITLQYSIVFKQYTKIQGIAKEYILKMQTTGYLTDELKAELEETLQANGMKDISYDGSTASYQESGNKIILVIKGTYQYTIAVPSFSEKKTKTISINIKISEIGVSFA